MSETLGLISVGFATDSDGRPMVLVRLNQEAVTIGVDAASALSVMLDEAADVIRKLRGETPKPDKDVSGVAGEGK